MSSFFGMPIINSPHVPDGQFFIIDRTIYTSMSYNKILVALWVADAMKRAKQHLRVLVSEAEERLGLEPIGAE